MKRFYSSFYFSSFSSTTIASSVLFEILLLYDLSPSSSFFFLELLTGETIPDLLLLL
jgi:hypothetical protein